MSKTFKPWPYQEKMIRFALMHERCCLFVPMGMGKTSASLAIVRELLDYWGGTPVLVVAPLAVARATWPAEVEKWDQFKDIRVSAIVGSMRERYAACRADADLYVINYENLPWLADRVRDKSLTWRWRTVIADESTRLKSFRKRGGSKRARALARFAGQIERFIALTGTPSPNGLADLWGQLWFVDAGLRLGASFSAFQSRWFSPLQVGADAHAVQWVPRLHAADEIQERIKDVCLSIRAEDYFDLDHPVFVSRVVRMPTDAEQAYRAMEKQLFVQLTSGAEVEAVNAAAKSVKCLQIASGALYTDDEGHWEPVHDAKLDELESIVNEAGGEPLLIAYQFKSDRERILARFPQAQAFDGSRAMVDAFNAGRIEMLLVHPASAGHGISLQDGSSKLVFFSQWWDLEQWQQVIERIGPMRQLQAGHPRVVTVYSIVAKGTIDIVAMAAKNSKKSTQDALLEYLREKEKSK